ncbi:L-serine dehydratase, partial [Tremellales sp. Uapishka_1]
MALHLRTRRPQCRPGPTNPLDLHPHGSVSSMRGFEESQISLNEVSKAPYTDFEIDEAGESPPGKSNRRKIWIAVAIGSFVIAMGVGLGAGLGIKHSTSSSSSNTSSSIATTPPNNSSSVTTVVPRETLLGDVSRWAMSNRNFEISATPQTRTFNWTLSQVLSAPGSMNKPMIVINGLSPGPVVEANLGDRLIINVSNNMTNETAMHWHGQSQRGSNYMDGTYAITQYTDGMFGPLIFHAPNETAMTSNPYHDDYTFILNDMYNTESSALNWRFEAVGTGIDGQPGDEPTPDGGMINGVGQAACAYIPSTDLVIAERKRGAISRGTPHKGSMRKRSSTSGTYYPETNYCGNITTSFFNATMIGNATYRIRLINAGTFVNVNFSIDNHTLTVIEADGTSVVPFNVSSINLAVAQRYSVLVTLDQEPGAYWIRNVLDTDQIRYSGPGFNETTLGILRYAEVDDDISPADTPQPAGGTNLTAFDATTLVPANVQDALTPTHEFPSTRPLLTTVFFNQSSWAPLAPGNAAIFDVTSNATTQSLGSQLSLVNRDVGVFDLIVNSLDDGNHPFHLHGHTFQIMAQGDSQFYGDSYALNVTNPMRRDTIVIPSYGHVVLRFASDNLPLRPSIHSLKVSLHGSLAATGVGHMTPDAVVLGLLGEDPETVEVGRLGRVLEEVKAVGELVLGFEQGVRVKFDLNRDLSWHLSPLPAHPNGLRFTVCDAAGDMIATNEYFSVGGGFVVNEKTQTAENLYYKDIVSDDAPASRKDQTHTHDASDVLPLLEFTQPDDSILAQKGIPPATREKDGNLRHVFSTAEELQDICLQHNLTISQVVWENELAFRSAPEIRNSLMKLWNTMDECIRNGVTSTETTLPGGFNVRRRAPGLYARLKQNFYPAPAQQSPASTPASDILGGSPTGSSGVGAAGRTGLASINHRTGSLIHDLKMAPLRTRPVFPGIDYLSCMAIAVNEVNASGGRVVTAPTNGAAGVIPASLKYVTEFISHDVERDAMNFLLTAAAIGMLFKRGATISAAEGGCMAEVGVACSMAAAGISACLGAEPATILQAAEIGIDLGLTCDPLGGLVQIPCIERNSLGAVKAITGKSPAFKFRVSSSDGTSPSCAAGYGSLDDAIEACRTTALDMHTHYKETSLGGLAATVKIPLSSPAC